MSKSLLSIYPILENRFESRNIKPNLPRNNYPYIIPNLYNSFSLPNKSVITNELQNSISSEIPVDSISSDISSSGIWDDIGPVLEHIIYNLPMVFPVQFFFGINFYTILSQNLLILYINDLSM